MFGLFNKKTTTLSDKLADKLSKQFISWEIHINYNLDEKNRVFPHNHRTETFNF